MIWLPELSDANMKIIFNSILEGHLTPRKKADREKRGGLMAYSKHIVASTVDCYSAIRE